MADNLFQVAPGLASYFAGQTQSENIQMDQVKRAQLAQMIQAAQQQQDQDRQMNPLLLERQRLANQGVEAGLPGITAESKSRTLKASRDEATQQSTIEASNAQNEDAVSKSKMDQFERAQKAVMEAGAASAQVAPPLRRAAVEQSLKGAGVNINVPHVQALLSLPPEQMPGAAQQLADALGRQRLAMDPQAQAHIQGSRISAGATVQAANIHAAATRYTADQHLAAQKAKIQQADSTAETLLNNVMAGKISTDKAAAAAAVGMSLADTDEEKEVWRKLGATIEQYTRGQKNATAEGKLSIGADGKLTPRTITSTFGEKDQKRGSGTKDDPIVLK